MFEELDVGYVAVREHLKDTESVNRTHFQQVDHQIADPTGIVVAPSRTDVVAQIAPVVFAVDMRPLIVECLRCLPLFEPVVQVCGVRRNAAGASDLYRDSDWQGVAGATAQQVLCGGRCWLRLDRSPKDGATHPAQQKDDQGVQLPPFC